LGLLLERRLWIAGSGIGQRLVGHLFVFLRICGGQ
jgi:hypothetical protein